MEINKLISKYNFNAGNASRIKYIVIHYVGELGDAKANANYYASGNKNASAHYFVGHSGDVWQSVEDKNIAWHCGSKSGYKHPKCRNANSIGVEMCVRKTNKSSLNASDKDWYFEDATVKATIELTKYLMEKYNIDANHVVRHYDVTGKCCPNPYVYNLSTHTWSQFKSKITENKIQNGNIIDIGGTYMFDCPVLKPGNDADEYGMLLWQTLLKGRGYNEVETNRRWDDPTFIATLDYKKMLGFIKEGSSDCTVTKEVWQSMIALPSKE